MLRRPLHPIHPASLAGWLGCAAGLVLAGAPPLTLQAGERPVANLVEKKIAKIDSLMLEAKALLTEAELLYAKGEFEESAKVGRQAWLMLPDSPLTDALKLEARNACARATVAMARKQASTGRYGEAHALLKVVLAADFDPANKEALKLQKELDDPEHHEPALTPAHAANVERVSRDLRLGSGFLTLGDYDSAVDKFSEVLRVDPYNQAARRGLERAEQFKMQYLETARDHFRAKRLNEVNAAWEDAVPAVDLSSLFGGASAGYGALGVTKESMLVKIRSYIIPVLNLQGASLEEVVEFLRIRSRELDPQKRGVDFVLKVSPELAAKPVTLSMVNVPIEEVLRYATEMTGTVYRADEYAITISSHAERGTTLITKSYRVPPDFIQNAAAGEADANAPVDPFQASKPAFDGLKIRRLGAKEFLEQRGIAFPEGASAAYNPGTNILFVRNTAESLALIDALVEQVSSAAPKQLEVQVRLVEVNETRLRELGFDWLMGQFNVPGSNKVFGGGGTYGGDTNLTPADFPMAPPPAGPNLQFPISPAPTGTNPPIGGNPLTAGLRGSGSLAAKPSIDQLIGRVSGAAPDARAPGAFAVTGVFTDPQFQVVLRALSQSKGVDLLVSPMIVAKSGQRSSITVVREMIYPTEFDPPQVPQQVGGAITLGDTVFETAIPDVVPIPPATPTAFDSRNVGISLEVEPVVGENNRTVDLNLVPTSTEFEGFIDYGTDIPIPNRSTGTSVLQLNDVLQPIFRTNKVTTSVTIWDGSTIVLGGAMYDKRQDINDKVPILGDLPIIGRSFQSKVSQSEKKNVIFFVTVRVIDPAGIPVNQPTLGPESASR